VTSRVFECHARFIAPVRKHAADTATQSRASGWKITALTAVLLVPVAGAAEPPQGWIAAAVTAVAILVLLPIAGGRAPWGWLAVLLGLAALVLPRGPIAAIGPALFVGVVLSLVIWLANRGSDDASRGRRPRPGSRERDAQEVMGLSGERHVGQVLARELPQDYVLINGLALPRGAGDIDHLVVGPTGVFLLETKTMAGTIVCEPNGTWRRTRVGRAGTPYAAYIGDPAAQVLRNIHAVRDCLRLRLPGRFGRRSLWVEGLVVFPHPRTELATEHSRVPAIRLEHATPRICAHNPKRALDADEVDAVVDALLVEGQARGFVIDLAAQSAQAMVELALALPLVLALLLGTLALSRVVQAQTAVVALAHEAARAGALATGPDDAVDRMRHRLDLVAPGLGVDPRQLVLDWDVSTFGRDRGRVVASVRYPLNWSDLPLGGWIPVSAVRAEHVEWVDPFRAGIAVIE
jgi:hypothetical protein